MSAFGAQLEWLLRWLGLDVERLPVVPAWVVRRQADLRARSRRATCACLGCLLLGVLVVGVLAGRG